MHAIPEEQLNLLKGIFDQDINIVNVLSKNYNSIMNFEKFDKIYLDELSTALKLVEPQEKLENGNQLSKMMEQTINCLQVVSATQNSYVNEFTQKLLPSMKAYKDEVLDKKVNANSYQKVFDNLMKKQVQMDNETDFEKKQKLGKEHEIIKSTYTSELKQINDNVTSYSSDRAQEYKVVQALFLHMIYYSMEMHAKCLEELTLLNSSVENFDQDKYKQVIELSEQLIQNNLFQKKE